MLNLIKLIEEIVEKEAVIERHPPAMADMRANHADVSKAGRLLGWEPHIGLREGVGRLVLWYNANRAWAKDLRTE